ncbi:MAG: response regulator [Anaerolineae bacterium]|nr:response regulator [Anaerolineae bacterium]
MVGTQDLQIKEKILIIDDDLVNLHLCQTLLSAEEYIIQTLSDGNQALDIAREDPPDLILLDIMMPEISGYEVCEQFKADPQLRDIPVVFLSALSTAVDKVKAFAVGAIDYIPKPFQSEEILARIRTHLALRHLQKDLQRKNLQLEHEVAERRQAEEKFRSYAERLHTLHQIDQSILAARSPETIAIAAVGRIRQIIPCQRVTVLAIDRQGQLRTLAADSASDIALDTQANHYREVLDNLALRAGRPHGVQDMSALTHLSPMQEYLHAAGIRAYFIMPLYIRDELVGTLHLESTRPNVFDADDVTAAFEIAILLAIAIRQVQLYELAQQEIAERKEIEEALRQQTVELETRNAELDAYAHTVAHDLKTPLTSLFGFSMLLQGRFQQMPDDMLQHNLDLIAQNAQRMTDIINALLLHASVRKMTDIPVTELNMQEIVTEVQKRFATLIDENHAEVIVAEKWPVAQGYGPWIIEVWANYVSNAIKYGGQPPRVEMGATELEDGMVRFWVRDNGQGLNAEQQKELFTPFSRFAKEQAEGHGLGLTIVQRIVHKLGGTVGAQSEEGKGSEFFFTLPQVVRTSD